MQCTRAKLCNSSAQRPWSSLKLRPSCDAPQRDHDLSLTQLKVVAPRHLTCKCNAHRTHKTNVPSFVSPPRPASWRAHDAGAEPPHHRPRCLDGLTDTRHLKPNPPPFELWASSFWRSGDLARSDSLRSWSSTRRLGHHRFRPR